MSALCDFGCGWIAGVCGLVCGHPADTIKVRQQTLGGISAWRCVVATCKYEGVLAFYKGMSFPMLAAGVMNSLFFGVYGSTLRLLGHTGGPETAPLSSVYFAGCVGGMAQIGIACPVDLVKIKLQAQTGTTKAWGVHYEPGYRGPLSCLAGVYHAEGLTGFYRGLVPMLYRDIPASGIYMIVYQYVIRAFQPPDGSLSVPVLGTLLAGGLAGSISWGMIVPLDVIKSRLQADRPDKPLYRGMMDCVTRSYQTEGLSVFGRGFWMVVLRAFPVNAAIFFGYEHCMRSCQRQTL